jgi:outer membrane receptor protein involved in Fe transport
MTIRPVLSPAGFLALLLLAPVEARAGQETPPSPEPVKREEVVVVTASKVESTIMDAPATISVVGAQAIETAPVQGYAELLRSVPGLNVIQMSARDWNVTARQATGTIATSQIALVDGRSIYLDFFGVILWDTISLEPSEIKQIEVVRGPASAVWGANAMTGVVNILTKSPRDFQGTDFTLNAGTFSRDAGSGVGRDAGFAGGGNVALVRAPSDRFSYKVSAGYFYSDPFARPAGQIPVIPDPRIPGAFVGGATYPIDGPGPAGAAFENEGARQPKVDVRADRELSDGGRIRFSAGVAGSAGIVHTGIGPFRVDNDSHFDYGHVSYTRGHFRLAAFANLVDAKAPSLFAIDPTTGQAVRLDFKTQTYDLELSHSRILGSRHLFSYGGNVRQNNFDISLAPAGENRTEFGGYVQDEFFVDRFRLNAGVRVDKFGNLPDAVFSPRISALFKPTPSLAFRASFNRAFRSPSVVNNYLEQAIVVPTDLSALAPLLPPPLNAVVAQPFPLVVNAVGSTSLDKESLTAYEVGFTGKVADRTTFGLAFYINDVDDSINFVALPTSQDPYTVQNPPPFWVESGLPPALIGLLAQQGVFLPRTAFQYKNLGPIRNKGLEASVDRVLSKTLTGFANYSWQSEPEVLDDPNPFPPEELAFPPQHRVNVGLGLDQPRYLGMISVSYTSRAFWSDVLTSPYHGYSDAYTLLNASFGVRFHNRRYTTMLKGTNLLNQDVQQHIFGDILKRSLSLELRLEL